MQFWSPPPPLATQEPPPASPQPSAPTESPCWSSATSLDDVIAADLRNLSMSPVSRGALLAGIGVGAPAGHDTSASASDSEITSPLGLRASPRAAPPGPAWGRVGAAGGGGHGALATLAANRLWPETFDRDLSAAFIESSGDAWRSAFAGQPQPALQARPPAAVPDRGLWPATAAAAADGAHRAPFAGPPPPPRQQPPPVIGGLITSLRARAMVAGAAPRPWPVEPSPGPKRSRTSTPDLVGADTWPPGPSASTSPAPTGRHPGAAPPAWVFPTRAPGGTTTPLGGPRPPRHALHEAAAIIAKARPPGRARALWAVDIGAPSLEHIGEQAALLAPLTRWLGLRVSCTSLSSQELGSWTFDADQIGARHAQIGGDPRSGGGNLTILHLQLWHLHHIHGCRIELSTFHSARALMVATRAPPDGGSDGLGDEAPSLITCLYPPRLAPSQTPLFDVAMGRAGSGEPVAVVWREHGVLVLRLTPDNGFLAIRLHHTACPVQTLSEAQHDANLQETSTGLYEDTAGALIALRHRYPAAIIATADEGRGGGAANATLHHGPSSDALGSLWRATMAAALAAASGSRA